MVADSGKLSALNSVGDAILLVLLALLDCRRMIRGTALRLSECYGHTQRN
jgi:hypothetical protein